MPNLDVIQREVDSMLNELRLLVFVEVAPLSNTYHQVALDEEQFKKLTNLLCKVEGKMPNGVDKVTLATTFETYMLPDVPSVQ